MPSFSASFDRFSAWLLESKTSERIFLLLVVLLCAIGNLPWHLDNYDQAKQAYVSYEIEQGGSWWYQHTPRGATASKPPLAGWVSLPFYWLTGSWDIAWRLPGLLCTMALIWLLAREARKLLPRGGVLIAACALGLNLLTPRIATLVRTDMMLTLFITLCGLLMYRKISSATPWTTAEKWIFFTSMLAAFFTKGPIIYAFILPGMAAFWLLTLFGPIKPAPGAISPARYLWSGWWTWAIPLLLFVVWGLVALKINAEFYNDIVVKEFFSRFDQSLKSHERQQPIWFYFPHLLHKFAPWSLLLLVLPLASQNVRRKLATDPATLWLACWAVGGLLCMTFIPSKRVDRIFPVVPPFCLLLVSLIAACQCGKRIRMWCAVTLVAGTLMTAGYFLTIVLAGYVLRNDVLARFGSQSQELARQAGAGKIAVARAKDEGMVMYCNATEFMHHDKVARLWESGDYSAIVIPENRVKEFKDLPPPALDSGPLFGKNERRYLLFIRSQP